MPTTTLGQRLKAASAARGKSLQSLEGKPVPRGYPSLIAGGRRENVGPEILAALADRLGVDFNWLATGRGTMEGSATVVREPAPDPRIDQWIDMGRLPLWVAKAAGDSAGGFAAYTDDELWGYCTNLVSQARRPRMPPLEIEDPKPKKRGR